MQREKDQTWLLSHTRQQRLLSSSSCRSVHPFDATTGRDVTLCVCVWVFSEHLAVRSHAQICVERLRRFLEDGFFEIRVVLNAEAPWWFLGRLWQAEGSEAERWQRNHRDGGEMLSLFSFHTENWPRLHLHQDLPVQKTGLYFIFKIYKDQAWVEEKFFKTASADICGYLLQKYTLSWEITLTIWIITNNTFFMEVWKATSKRS